MSLACILLTLAITNFTVDIVTIPLSSDARVALTPSGRAELKREGTVTRVKIDIDRVSPSTTLGPAMNSYVVWAVSPEGLLDNLGELDTSGNKGQINATTRFTQFGILITAEPHYMVDRPNSAVAFRNQVTPGEIRHKTASVEIGAYDYSMLTPATTVGVHGSIVQARTAFQIAQRAGAERLASEAFRNAQVSISSLEELLTRSAPLEILWPTANEAIRWSQVATVTARAKR